MSAKAVKLVAVPTHTGNLSDLDNDLTKQVRALVNSSVREYMKKGGRIHQLALKAHLSDSTVSKLAYYETTRPMWRTVIGVMDALNLYDEVGKMMIAYGRSRN